MAKKTIKKSSGAVLTVRLTKADKAGLAAVAKRADVSVGHVIRKAVAGILDAKEGQP